MGRKSVERMKETKQLEVSREQERKEFNTESKYKSETEKSNDFID